MTTPVTTILNGGQLFDLTWQMAHRGVLVKVYRKDVLVMVVSDTPPTLTGDQHAVPAPKDRDDSEAAGNAGVTGRAWIVFIGWYGVAGKVNFDVQHGDKIIYADVPYRVTAVDYTVPNRLEVTAESLK